MKNFFLLLFCFVSSFVFSQKYHFDYFLKEQSDRIKPEKNQWLNESFYDSKNLNYLNILVQNNKIIAVIYEKEKHKRHVFKVNKLNNELSFVYNHTNQFPQPKKTNNNEKENVIKVKKLDSLKFNIIVYKNSKLKRKKISAIVTLEKSEFNYINFGADYSRRDEVNEKIKSFLNPNAKYIIKSQQINYISSGFSFDKSIQNIQKTDLTIEVPNKLVLKEYTFWSDFAD